MYGFTALRRDAKHLLSARPRDSRETCVVGPEQQDLPQPSDARDFPFFFPFPCVPCLEETACVGSDYHFERFVALAAAAVRIDWDLL